MDLNSIAPGVTLTIITTSDPNTPADKCTGVFIYRELNWGTLRRVFRESVITTASIMVLVGCANIFAYILSKEQIPQAVADLMLSITRNRYLLLLLINLLLLFVGMFMDGAAAVIVLAPILAPIAQNMGISQIHFGVVMVLNLIIGCGTPPLGACLFIACKIANISVERGVRGIMPYVIAEIAVLALVTYIPALSTYVPQLLGYAI